jgi:quercetin dioxygenase-like cupin family protein
MGRKAATWEAIMRAQAKGMVVLIGALAIAGTASAQNATPPPATVRTVIAATKLPTVTDTPLYFDVVNVTLAPGQKTGVSKANGVLYQLSGTTDVSLAGETKTINAEEGLFIGAGKSAELKAGGAPSTFLHFFLVPAADVDKPAEASPAVVKQVYRTPAPIPDLRAGGYDLNLTRVTFPAGMPSNAPHHRSGAALYYVLSGTGANTIDGKVISRAPGAFIYEPFDLVHQWGNPGSEPLTFITFNINPEGDAAVLQGAPAKTQ